METQPQVNDQITIKMKIGSQVVNKTAIILAVKPTRGNYLVKTLDNLYMCDINLKKEVTGYCSLGSNAYTEAKARKVLGYRSR